MSTLTVDIAGDSFQPHPGVPDPGARRLPQPIRVTDAIIRPQIEKGQPANHNLGELDFTQAAIGKRLVNCRIGV